MATERSLIGHLFPLSLTFLSKHVSQHTLWLLTDQGAPEQRKQGAFNTVMGGSAASLTGHTGCNIKV